MLLVASVSVLAQQEGTPPTGAPAPAPAGITIGYQMLFEDLAALCPVEENGEIPLPAGLGSPASLLCSGATLERRSISSRSFATDVYSGAPLAIGFGLPKHLVGDRGGVSLPQE
jgi:hypothetical protein